MIKLYRLEVTVSHKIDLNLVFTLRIYFPSGHSGKFNVKKQSETSFHVIFHENYWYVLSGDVIKHNF